MLAAAVTLLAFAVLAGVVVAVHLTRPAPVVDPPIVRRVSLSIRPTPGGTDTALIGALVEDRGPVFVLRGAVLAQPGREPVPLDGEVLVDRVNVDFVQVLAPITGA